MRSRTPELIAVNVLRVADPSPQQNVAAERLAHQQDLLETAREIAAGMDVNLRTRAVIGSRVDETVLETLVEEDADQVLLGWQGSLTGAGYVFGPNLDSVVERAPCEVSLVTLGDETVGTPVALAGPGPHSPVAARRAVEFATVDGTVPTLLNVQRSRAGDGTDPFERGAAVVAEVADRAGLDPEDYETEVVVADDVGAAILDAVRGYETVCVGLSERSDASRVMFGTIAERVSQEATGNVAIVRGSYGTTSGTDASTERPPSG